MQIILGIASLSWGGGECKSFLESLVLGGEGRAQIILGITSLSGGRG